MSDFETKSNAGAWAQVSSCQRKATVCEGGSCSLGATETATSCVHRGLGKRSYVFSVVDCRTGWMSGSENEAEASPSRAIVVEEVVDRQARMNRAHGWVRGNYRGLLAGAAAVTLRDYDHARSLARHHGMCLCRLGHHGSCRRDHPLGHGGLQAPLVSCGLLRQLCRPRSGQSALVCGIWAIGLVVEQRAFSCISSNFLASSSSLGTP